MTNLHDWLDKHIIEQAAIWGVTPEQKAKLTGMVQGPHEEWYVTTEGSPTCPHCGRDLDGKAELALGLCTSDDCPRWDVTTEESK